MVGLTYNFCHVTCLAHGLKGVHLCAGGTLSAFSEIFFRENYLKFFNELYVI